MRANSFEKFTCVRFAWVALALPLMGCEWLTKPCAPDLLNTPENQAKSAFGCFCTLEQKADPEHLCCTTAGTCSEDSGLPDPETSDPAGDLSLVLNGLRTLPLDPIQRVCDGAAAEVEIAWEYVNIANGAVGDWTAYALQEPLLQVSIVGVGPVAGATAGWSALPVSGVEPHREEFDLAPESYSASVSGLPIGVQNRSAVTNRTITNLTSGDPWYDSACGD